MRLLYLIQLVLFRVTSLVRIILFYITCRNNNRSLACIQNLLKQNIYEKFEKAYDKDSYKKAEFIYFEMMKEK